MDTKTRSKQINDSHTSDGTSRRQRFRNNRSGGGGGGGHPNQNKKRFSGVNQDEMKGVVISKDGVIDTSQQYEKFTKTLLVLAGKLNPDVRAALEYSTPLTKADLYTEKPKKEAYTIITGDVTIEDEDKKELLLEIWRDDNKRASKRFERYEDDSKKIYSVITGQLCDGMLKELHSKDDWNKINMKNDPIKLLEHLKEICYRDNETKTNPAMDLINKAIKFLTSKQENGKDASKFAAEVKVKFDVFKSNGGSLISPRLMKYAIKRSGSSITYDEFEKMEINDERRAQLIDAAEELLIANVMIRGSNDKAHHGIAGVLQDDYSRGRDSFPGTSARALAMMNQYISRGKGRNRSPGAPRDRGNGGGRDKPNDHQGTKESEASATTFATKASIPTEEEAHQLLMRGVEEEDTSNKDDRVCFMHYGITETGPTSNEILEAAEGWGVKRAVRWGQKPRSGTPQSRSWRKPRSASEGSICFEHSNDVHYLFAQTNGSIDRDWLLLDSQANLHMVCNPQLLINIRELPDRRVRVQCNAGTVTVNTVGELPGFGTVWYHEGGIANILSLGLLSNRYRVTLDTAVTNSIFVHKLDGSAREFHRSSCNLYVCNLREIAGTLLNMITTVDGKKEFYSDLDIRRAEKARKLQEIMGFPSLKSYLHMIDNNLIMNCPVTRRDVLIAEDMFGKNTNIVKGKSVRRQPKHVREDLTMAPPDILKNYGNVTLSIDIVSVNGVRFFRSISRHLQFRTCRHIKEATKSNMLKSVMSIVAIYAKRGFRVTQIFGDNEFNCLREDLIERGISYDPVGRGCHEPHVERDNRTFKERMRCIFASLPFNRIPTRMVIEMGHAVTLWLNCWCNSSGVSKTVSPRELLTGIRLDANKHLKFQFGDYVLGYSEETSNDMEPRAIDGIFLRPTGSLTGGMYVYDLKSAKRVHRNSASIAHMTTTIIQRVEAIAIAQKCPAGLLIGDLHGNSTIHDIDTASIDSEDDVTDDDYEPGQDDDSDCSLTDMMTESDDDSVGDLSAQGTDATEIALGPTVNDDNGDGDTTEHTPDERETVTENDRNVEEHTEADVADTESVASGEGAAAELEDETIDNDVPDPASPPRRHNLRPSVTSSHNKFGEDEGFEPTIRRRVHFSAGYSQAVKEIEREQQRIALVGELEQERIALVTSAINQYNNIDASRATKQYNVNQGLKIFGLEGSKAVYKELLQLHNLRVISPRKVMDLTEEEIERALPYLMFLKRKRCGKVKGRGCADGRSQRDYISKEEASSPTVSLHALMLSCVIDAIEGRVVATADVPGAFLQTEMPDDGDDVYIRLDGTMAELLAKIDPDTYGPCIYTNKRGRKVIYAKAEKAIYGTLKAALLFWKKLSGKLQEWGFEQNPYDMCTMNSMINGKQCTIVWHVDDLKISHVDGDVVADILDKLNAEFGKQSPLTATNGTIHDYVGMTIDYSEKGRVKFSMYDYIEEILNELPEDLVDNRICVTPAADFLFKVDDSKPTLDPDRADRFHRIVAKLLFIAKRARPDIQTAIAFLCTRVQKPNEDDEKKLKRVLGYLKSTIFLPLVLGADDSNNVYWYVDASFAVHKDMKSHTGGVMTLGNGAVISMSTKQKLNTKSSTEAELVGVDDTLPFNIWCHYFLRWQGYHALGCDPEASNNKGVLGERNILYQDNTSSIKLENNGKASSTKRTRHINIRYFTITDRVKKGEITIEYCPTGDMIADFLTKPLQGSLFRRLRNQIMGVTEGEFTSYREAYESAKASRAGDNISSPFWLTLYISGPLAS